MSTCRISIVAVAVCMFIACDEKSPPPSTSTAAPPEAAETPAPAETPGTPAAPAAVTDKPATASKASDTAKPAAAAADAGASPDVAAAAETDGPPKLADFPEEAEWFDNFLKWERLGDLGKHMSEADVIAKLGEPASRSEVGFIEGIGEHTRHLHWPDKGVIAGFSDDDPAMKGAILGLVIASAGSTLKTRLGVGVGTPEATMRAAYGGYANKHESSATRLSIGIEYDWIRFELADGKVSRVLYGAGWLVPLSGAGDDAAGVPGVVPKEPVDAAPFDAMLATCHALAGEGKPYPKLKSVETMGTEPVSGDAIFHGHLSGRGDKQVVFFGKDPKICSAWPIGRAIDGAWGDFLGDGRRLRIFAMDFTAAECSALTPAGEDEDEGEADEYCPAALVLRDADKNFLRVGLMHMGCERLDVKKVRLFEDRDSVQITCGSPVGGEDYHGHVVVYHAVEGDEGLRPVLFFEAGLSSTTPDTNEAGVEVSCTRPGPGTARAKTKGATPTVEVFEAPEDYDGESPITGTMTTWAWDAAKKAFAKGASVPHTRKGPGEKCTPAKK